MPARWHAWWTSGTPLALELGIWTVREGNPGNRCTRAFAGGKDLRPFAFCSLPWRRPGPELECTATKWVDTIVTRLIPGSQGATASRQLRRGRVCPLDAGAAQGSRPSSCGYRRRLTTLSGWRCRRRRCGGGGLDRAYLIAASAPACRRIVLHPIVATQHRARHDPRNLADGPSRVHRPQEAFDCNSARGCIHETSGRQECRRRQGDAPRRPEDRPFNSRIGRFGGRLCPRHRRQAAEARA